MIKTTKEYYPIEREINCYGQWDSMGCLLDCEFENEEIRNFIIDFAKEFSKTIKNEDDYEEFIDQDISGWSDEEVFDQYCDWLNKKYLSHEFNLHVIPKGDDDCYFVIEANKRVRGKNERSMD